MADNFPAWFYGPNGQSQIFNSEDEIPKGWVDHPAKVSSKDTGTVVPEPDGGLTVTELDALDADGWPWDETLHAATRSQTKAGLWRMNVGVKRPDPKPGFPVLDL